MPPGKATNSKYDSFSRSSSNGGGLTLSARVYHAATNLMPPSPPGSPTGIPPNFSKSTSSSSMTFSRQNSQGNGKY